MNHITNIMDAFAMRLDYYAGDFTSRDLNANTATNRLGKTMDFWLTNSARKNETELHDGNIAAWKWTAASATPWRTAPVQEYYRYDRLGRIRQSRRGATGFTNDDCKLGYQRVDPEFPDDPDLTYNHITNIGNYGTSYLYDRGGNLMGLNRMGNSTAGLIDKLAYQYETVTRPDYTNPGTVTRLSSNKLQRVTDAAQGTEGMPTGQTAYTYDGDGNLKEDPQNRYVWNVCGKLESINKKSDNHRMIQYLYDGSGQRIAKWYKENSNSPASLELYFRDVTGNEMAHTIKGGGESYPSVASFNMYGSNRIGSHNADAEYQIGQRHYELTDHLGNVRATISDKRIRNGNIFEPQIVTGNEYYPFGMPSRTYVVNGEKYRFGFNTQEKVDEISGAGNHTTALFWEYDTRIGRRWNEDPVVKQWESSYLTFGGNPIATIDPNGDDNYKLSKEGKISLVKKTKSNSDKLIAKKGFLGIGRKAIKLEKGILNNPSSGTFTAKGITLDFKQYTVFGEGKGKKLFEFLASNSKVEWSIAKFSEGGLQHNVISTSERPGTEAGGAKLLRDTKSWGESSLSGFDHSHPSNDPRPSGGSLEPNDPQRSGDVKVAKDYEIRKNQSNILFRIFTPSNQQYNTFNGDYSEPRMLNPIIIPSSK